MEENLKRKENKKNPNGGVYINLMYVYKCVDFSNSQEESIEEKMKRRTHL